MTDKSKDSPAGDRIAKVIARAGLASRREAEAWVAAGRVAVNGKPITSPALNIGPRDRITIDGQPLPGRTRTRLFLCNKPRGLVTTHSDPEGRPTIFGALPKHLPRLISVGRLDMNTEGLLLLTNDGGLARALELPATGWVRRYRVRALGRVSQETLDGLKKGVTVEGIQYGPIEATLERQLESNCWLAVAIREGKNREVRRVMESLGLKVSRLIRIAFGPFELPPINECEVKEVETAALKKALGPEIVKQAEADFEAPLESPAPLILAKAGTRKDAHKRQGRGGARADEPKHGRDDDRPRKPLHNKRRRADRSGGPRPKNPRSRT
jgi:23S rRNA pseudouridine2605 synthase